MSPRSFSSTHVLAAPLRIVGGACCLLIFAAIILSVVLMRLLHTL